MPLTVTLSTPSHNVFGHQYKVTGTIAFDSAYPAGGEALAASTIGLRVIDSFVFDGNGHLGYIYYTDTVLPATSINVEILCPTGGTAPTTVAAPAVPIGTLAAAIGTLDATVDSGAVAVTSSAANGAIAAVTGAPTLTGAPGLTGGRGVEMGAADASSLTAVRFTAFGV